MFKPYEVQYLGIIIYKLDKDQILNFCIFPSKILLFKK